MRLFSSRSALAALALAGIALSARPAAAQIAGTTSRPLPDVLLLVDTSGSMERMPDGTLPVCTPGVPTEPNKWGMLVQALTGNMQSFFSCETLSRASGSAFAREFQINGNPPYDVDYFLDYHRPLSGDATDQCVMAPWRLPGSTTGGVGPNNNTAGGNATDFPDNALATVSRAYLDGLLAGGGGLTTTIPANQQCVFQQAPDGQLDATKDFVRFALMTFDNDTDEHLGVTSTSNLAGSNSVDFTATGTSVKLPFLGQWSFLRHTGNPFFPTPATAAGHAQGRPWTTPSCAMSAQEVGARNEAAPPWEGRLVKFPDPYASLYDLERQNEQLQKVLIASRPYGATPIDGMMDDARDYYLWYDNGPGGTNTLTKDPYQCRSRYIVLLTDGAPNLDLRPSCMGAAADPSSGMGDQCPYPATAAQIAADLVNRAVPEKVTTYVVGFAVSGEGTSGNGFPPGATPNCKGWYEDPVGVGGGGDPSTMKSRCDAVKPAAGTTAAACCKLNEIAYAGSSDGVNTPVGAYFAESQADVVLAFGRIMANITQNATTRTVPAYTPAAQYSQASFGISGSPGTNNIAGQFVASLIPNTQRPWSGDVDRTRYQCDATHNPVAVAQDTTKGDSEAFNLAGQTTGSNPARTIISVKAQKIGTSIDSATTIRPYVNSSSPSSFTGGDSIKAVDGSITYTGTEVYMSKAKTTSDLEFTPDWPLALNIDSTTCKRSRAVATGTEATRGTKVVPALDGPTGAQKCTDVVWGFATAFPGTQVYDGTPSGTNYDFNIRCPGTDAQKGTCSISGTQCTIGGPIPPISGPVVPTNGCPGGEICVPGCSALGGIYHSNPVVVGPPNDFLREEGFRTYAASRQYRQPVTYVASIDGLLHAFKAMEPGDASKQHELWAFAPPAVLPRLASNYPNGNQTILDGTPVVAETIWERAVADTTGANAAAQWHTTLVAGLGAGGGGYYALNVTDADCSNGSTPLAKGCLDTYKPPTGTSLDAVKNSGVAVGSQQPGPHFLWQLTDIPAQTTGTETAKVERQSTIKIGASRPNMMALFGKNTGTPAIGMVQIRAGGEERQVGVAVLPGGYEAPPTGGTPCPRGAQPRISDRPVRDPIRNWVGDCNATVPGRSVTIVRLDTGEILRHFARTLDTPLAVQNKVGAQTFFDSPIVGTPVIYPSGIGVPMQKIFVGDADGTVWRIDMSNTNPMQWSVQLFADLYSGLGAEAGKPILVPPVISTDETGRVVLNVASGDQDSIVVNTTEVNILASITDTRDSTGAPRALTNWYQTLTNAERITGPMVVFDHTLYAASYRPVAPSGATCGDPGYAYLWGLDFERAAGATAASGGMPKWCPVAYVDSVTGACSAPSLVPFEQQGTALIPGVALQTSTACTDVGTAIDEYGTSAFSTMTPVSYSLSFGVAQSNSSGSASSPQAGRSSLKRQLPTNATRIDSWSIVIE